MDEQVEKFQPKRARFTRPKVMYYALIVIFMAVFVLSGIYLAGYFLETGSAEQDYDELASIYQEGNRGSTPPSSAGNTGGTGTTQPPTILPELQPIYEMNNELVGYLSFPYDDLRLSYPVMQSPHDSDYYLTYNFYKRRASRAVPMYR